MLGSVVYQVLAGYLGHYVKDIQREQFRIGLWSGEVLLENVDLRLEAFDSLPFPLSIKQASIGKLKIHVPWKKLGWEPILISLEDVSIGAGPQDDGEWDAKASERRELAAKRAALASAEIAKFSKCVSETKSGQSFLSNFFGKIIDNVQVVVKNVHIQYTDKKTDPEMMFLVGLTLSSLTVSTSDASFAASAGGGKMRGSQEHKVVEVNQLALYWNPQNHPLGLLEVTDNQIISGLRKENYNPDKVVYLLRPTDVTLKLLLNKNMTGEEGVARYAVVVSVDDLSLALEDLQLRGMLLLFDAISIARAREKYGRFRPQSNDGQDGAKATWTRQLWQYAVDAVLSDVRKILWRRSLGYLVWRRAYRERYVNLYINKLENLERGQSSGEQESTELEEIERQFEMDEILYFRSLAERNMPLDDIFGNAAVLNDESGGGEEGPTAADLRTPQPVLQQKGWLNWLSLGFLGAAERPDAGQILPHDVIKDLYEGGHLQPTPVLENGESSKGQCRLAITLHVGELLGILHSSKLCQDILNVSVQGIAVTAQMWVEMTSVSVMVRTLEAVDLCTPGTRFSRIVAPWGKPTCRASQRKPARPSYAEALAGSGLVRGVSDCSMSTLQGSLTSDEDSTAGEKSEPLLHVEVELQPKRSDHDLTITVVLQPVEFVYSATLIKRASLFFSFSASHEVVNDQVDLALKKLEDVAVLNFKHKIVERKRLRLLLDIRRPNLLFPENNLTSNGILMIFAVDSIIFASQELRYALGDTSSKGHSRTAIFRGHSDTKHGKQINLSAQVKNGCNQDFGDMSLDKCGNYDRFQLRLTGAQVLISGNSGDWHETLKYHESDMEWLLVGRFKLQVAIDISVKGNHPLPRFKILGNLPALRLHLSLGKCSAVNSLLTKLLNGDQLDKDTLETAAFEKHPHVGECFTWEMSMNLNVVTVDLSLDSERHDASMQMKKKALVAQGQEMTFKYVQRSSYADLEVSVKTVHVEDTSELASSPFRYLLYCAGCHRSTNPSTPVVDMHFNSTKSAESSEEKFAACLKMVLEGPTGLLKLGVMAAFHGLEFHVNPVIFRALHGFALAAMTPKTLFPSQNSQTSTTISDASSSSFFPDYHFVEETLMYGEEAGPCSVYSGLPIKSPVHNQMQAIALSSTLPSHPGSTPNVNFQDVENEGEWKHNLVLFFEKLASQLLPLCAMFQNQIARNDHIIIDVQLDSCAVQFLDAGGVVGVLILPDATVCTSVPCATASGEEALEIVVVSSDLQLKGTQWASGNIKEDPVGSLSFGPSATWDIRVRKDVNGNFDVVIQIHNAQVVLMADYLAGLIQYFDRSQWTSMSKSTKTNACKSVTVCWKVEVEDSVLFLSRERSKDEFIQLVLGEFLLAMMDDYSTTTSYYIMGQKVSVTVQGTDNVDGSGADFAKSSCGQTLVERWDGEMVIEVPSSNLPTCLEIHSSILELILDGTVFEKQAEAFQSISQDLSAVEWTSNTMALTTVHGGLASWIPGKYIHVNSPRTGSLNLRFCVLKLFITFTTTDSGNKSLLPVAVLQVDSLDMDLGLNRGTLETLTLEVLSIVLLQHTTKLKLLQCQGSEELAIQPALKVLVNSEGPESEVYVSLPSIQVWLHISAWSQISPVIAASLRQSKPHTVSDDSSLLDPSDCLSKTPSKVKILVLQEDLDFSSSSRVDIHTINSRISRASSGVDIPMGNNQQYKNPAILVKVGKFRLALLVLDSSKRAHDSENVVEGEDSSLPQKALAGKSLSCTLSLRVDEFRFNKDGTWTLAAGITQGEGNIVEDFEEQEAFQELCFQAAEILVSVDGSFQQSPIVRFDMKVTAECVSFWCCYPILRFFREFTFEELEGRSSPRLDIEGKAELRLQHSSIVLSDGRWSCKAPIVEILLGNITAKASLCVQKLEASLSTDLEANYHNMHKVSWEPLVEPWSVISVVTVQNTLGSPKSQDCTKIKVSSSAKLNINITESLVQAASRAIEMVHDAWSEDSNSRDTRLGSLSQYAPYWLQNDTGVAITYWLLESRHNRDELDVGGSLGGWGSGRGTVLDPGKSVALYQQGSVEEILSMKRNSGLLRNAEPATILEVSLQHRMICVQIEGTSRPSPPLSIDLVGSRSFEASFSENEFGDVYNSAMNNTSGTVLKQNSFQRLEAENREKGDVFRTPVMFEVTIQRYSKLVRLCSTVSVVNMISVPLEVRFDIPFTISPKVMEPVLPGEVMPLPVHLAQTGKIRWRPLGNNYVWSEVQSIRNLLQSSGSPQGLHRPVLCYPNSHSNRPFRSCLSVSHSAIAGVDSSFGELTQGPVEVGRVLMGRPIEFKLWDITLQAPLVVKNCLPLPVLITIDSGAGSIISHTAAEGNSHFVYDVDTVHSFSVTFCVQGFLTSSATVMQAAQSIVESSRRTDKEGRVRAFESVNFFPEILSDPVVGAELELSINMITGTREICISVPFWLYNCSSLNLAVIDGDVDVYSGRQKFLAKVPASGAAKEKQETELKPGLASLQEGAHQAGDKSFGWFSKHRLISQKTTVSTKKLIDVKESISSKCENLDECWGLLVPHMYSPVKGIEASEHRLRARVVHPVRMETRTTIEQSWSRPFSVDIPDGNTTVTVPRPQNQGAYVFSVVCNPVLGFGAGKSKTVTFRPRFLLGNSCKRDLCVKQQGTDLFDHLPVGQHCHLHWTDMARALLVSVRFSDHGWDWSGGFAPDQLGDTQVKVRNHTSGATQMLRVEVSTMTSLETSSIKGVGSGSGTLGTCLILLSDDETGFMPYRIDNFSMERINFHQQNCEKMENTLHPYSSFCYAWDEPCHPHRLVLEVPGGGPLGVYGLDDVREYSPITLLTTSQECGHKLLMKLRELVNLQKPDRTFIFSVRAEGPIRVLSIADTSLHLMNSPSDNGSVFASTQPFAGPSNRILESTVTDTESIEELFVDFSYIGVSLIDSVPQEIIFSCVKGLRLQLTQGQHQQQLKLEIAMIQIDNQLRFAVYPVLLSSTYPHAKLDEFDHSARVGKDLKPLENSSLTLLIVKWRHPAGSVDCFQCISLRIVPMRLEVEEQVVSSLLNFMDKIMDSFPGIRIDKLSSSKVPAWSLLRWNRFTGQEQFLGQPWKFEVVQDSTIQSRDLRFRKVVKRLKEYHCWAAAAAVEPVGGLHQKLPLLVKEKSKAYIEMLHISPVELTVSFSSTPWLSNQSGATTKNSLVWMTGMMLQHHVMAIADAEDAVMNLRRLAIAHPLASWDAIRGMITRHYTRQLLQEVYKVVGSADVLGNPIHFVRTLGSGMWDFVSTPAKSLKQSPKQLARGLIQGTHSLFSNTVFAFSNAATRMSKVARKTVTAFAFDKEYVDKMERREHSHGTEDLSVVNEFLKSLTGLLQSPVRGAERAGLPGMLSGAAVGALGVVARPVASILEVASKTGQSIVNRSSPKQWRATPIRLPRHLREDSPLLPYSWESAVGRAVLLETDGCFRNEVLALCLPLAHGNEFVLLTQTRILKVSSVKVDYLSGFKWHMKLVAAVEDILHMDHVENRVSVLLGPARREFVRTQNYSGLGHKVLSLPAHETLEFLDESALEQFLGVLHFLENRSQQSRSTILVSTRML